jgi:hypothetical protein
MARPHDLHRHREPRRGVAIEEVEPVKYMDCLASLTLTQCEA